MLYMFLAMPILVSVQLWLTPE